MKFEGYDFTEIAPVVGVTLTDNEDEDLEALRQGVYRAHDDSEKIAALREFVRAIVRLSPDSDRGIMRAIAVVTDDRAFLSWFGGNLERFWT